MVAPFVMMTCLLWETRRDGSIEMRSREVQFVRLDQIVRYGESKHADAGAPTFVQTRNDFHCIAETLDELSERIAVAQGEMMHFQHGPRMGEAVLS